MKKVHLIAIGGSAMHNLAIALHLNGFQVTGSDDEIFEPSKSRLQKHDLLPKTIGWNPNQITAELDFIILGMHARKDNPELLRAQELGLKIYSYPEFIYEQSKSKTRVVIGGSHGKTTVTSMILHVLKSLNKAFDYLVGAQIEGFDTMVQLSNAPIMIIEGDEYLSSPIDLRSKFLHYKPNIAVLTGVAWDHINVFPTFDSYTNTFNEFIDSIEQTGTLIYYKHDSELKKLMKNRSFPLQQFEYETPAFKIENNQTFLLVGPKNIPLTVFGEHNLQNLQAAYEVCKCLGITDDEFYAHIQSFKGAARRLEKIAESKKAIVFKDFAHSPSKLKATIKAVQEQYSNFALVACIELHTFSSLNKQFLPLYDQSTIPATHKLVYFNPATVAHKKLDPISQNDILTNFSDQKLEVSNDSLEVKSWLKNLAQQYKNQPVVFLIMTSGNFDGINLNEFAQELI